MLCDIRKQQKKWKKLNGENGRTDEQRWLLSTEFKIFKSINPLPLQVFALTAVGARCQRENEDIRRIAPKEVLEMAMVKAAEHARDNPTYPLRGVQFTKDYLRPGQSIRCLSMH